MAIADFNVVRKKAGNRSPDIISDDDITEAIQASDAIVGAALSKFNWATSDPGYHAVKEVSELFAAADLLSRSQDTQDRAKEEKETAQYYLDLLQKNFASAVGSDEGEGYTITIVTPDAKTFPMNPSAPYRRAFGRGEVSESLSAFAARTGDV